MESRPVRGVSSVVLPPGLPAAGRARLTAGRGPLRPAQLPAHLVHSRAILTKNVIPIYFSEISIFDFILFGVVRNTFFQIVVFIKKNPIGNKER